MTNLITDIFHKAQKIVNYYEEERKTYTAIMYMLVSGLFFILSGTFIKKITNVSSMQIFCLRSVCSFLINSSVIAIKGDQNIYTKDREAYGLLLKRVLFGFIADYFFVAMLKYLTIGDCTSIVMTYPIFSTILASIILKEHFSKYLIYSIVFCVIGIILVCKPPFILNYFFDSYSQSQSPNIFLGFLNGLGFVTFLSFSIVTTRKLGGKVTIQVLLQYLYFCTIFASTLFIMSSGDEIGSYVTLNNIFMIIGTGFSQYCANIFYNKSLFLEKATVVIPLSYTQVIFSFLSDVFIFKVAPNIFSIIGCLFIVSGSYLTLKQ
ncbi:hypothetical protein ABPG74_015045 [Tetrahymena malaccensis]